MVNPVVMRWIATGFAALASILSFTMLLARYNGSIDKEFPILLAEYFEINPKRNARIVDSRKVAPGATLSPVEARIKGTADRLEEVWQKVASVSGLLAAPESNVVLLANQSPDPQTKALASLLQSPGLKSLVSSGPIDRNFNLYRADFQAFLGKALPDFAYDSTSLASQQEYSTLSSTLGAFEEYTRVEGEMKTKEAEKAARSVVDAALTSAERLFEKLRIQTRVAVAASVAAILACCIALTVLIVGKKTYVLLALHLVAFIASIIFLSMIQLNSNKNADLLRLSYQPTPSPNAGPAVYGAGFTLASALFAGVFTALYLRFSNMKDDDETEMVMEEMKSTEAKVDV